MAVEVLLTRGLVALVDDDDAEMVRRYRWYPLKGNYGVYAATNSPTENGKRHSLYMHRLITGAPRGMDVDHINHNCLDNRRSNLRICTRIENMRNQRRAMPTKRAPYKGVFGISESSWRATIYINRKPIYLGFWATAEEAALAYNAAAREHFGEFAYTNDVSLSESQPERNPAGEGAA